MWVIQQKGSSAIIYFLSFNNLGLAFALTPSVADMTQFGVIL